MIVTIEMGADSYDIQADEQSSILHTLQILAECSMLADTSEEKVEEILENFLQNLKKGIDVDGNWVNIVVGEADWVEEGDSILKAKVAVQFDITFEGGIYQDRDIKPMDIGSVG